MNRLRDLREDRDLKQSDIAKILKISQQYYQCYESGKNEIPLRHCITLAKYYNVSIDFIAGIISTPKTLTGDRNETLDKYENLITKIKTAEPKIQKAIEILLQDGE